MKRDRGISRVYALFMAVYVAIVAFYYQFYGGFALTNPIIGFVMFLALPLAWIFFPLERLVNLVIPWINRLLSREVGAVVGNWHIDIYFNDDGEDKHRSGELKIIPTMYGLRIDGDKLYDKDTDSGQVTMESWTATDVQYWEGRDTKTFTYLYHTKEGGDSSDSNRTGIVVCYKKNG